MTAPCKERVHFIKTIWKELLVCLVSSTYLKWRVIKLATTQGLYCVYILYIYNILMAFLDFEMTTQFPIVTFLKHRCTSTLKQKLEPFLFFKVSCLQLKRTNRQCFQIPLFTWWWGIIKWFLYVHKKCHNEKIIKITKIQFCGWFVPCLKIPKDNLYGSSMTFFLFKWI